MIDRVHPEPEQDDARGREQPLAEAAAALGGIMQHCPEVRSASKPRILQAVVNGHDGRHARLQDEAECHRSAGPAENVPPDAVANLRGKAIPSHSENDQRNREKNHQPCQRPSRPWGGPTLCEGTS